MQIIKSLSEFPDALKSCAVSIGKFDGMHIGHSLIVRRLKNYANQRQIPAVIVTFDPPPASVLKPEFRDRPMCTLERKIELIQAYQPDALVVLDTTQGLLDYSADHFFQLIIYGMFDAKVIVEGHNFQFGHNRQGTAEYLRKIGQLHGIEVDIADFVQVGGYRVSSSHIRHLIENGRIELVNELMREPYRLTGKVVHGNERGRTLGFPTANLADTKTVLPKPGIYATTAWVGGKRYASTTHIGQLPTFKNADLRIEVFIHNFDSDLYGQHISVDFLARLRDVVKFDSTDALITQMHCDIERSERIAGR